AAAGAGRVVRRQEALRRIGDDLAGQRVDGLQQPRDRVRTDVYAGADAQDEPPALAEVEVALEGADRAGDVDLQVAELQITEAEGARIEIGVELLDDTDLADRRGRAGAVLELDSERQRLAQRHELLRSVGQGAVECRLPRPAGAGEERREVRRLHVDEIRV